MTQLAVLSDVHGDAFALERAIMMADRLRCTEFICLGDLVSYGEKPLRVVQLLQQHRIPCIRGNHDRWAINCWKDFDGHPLPVPVVDYLKTLPPMLKFKLDDVNLFASHAWPQDDLQGVYDDTPDADIHALMDAHSASIWLTGHSHRSFSRQVYANNYEDKWVFNPGAMLRAPRWHSDVPHEGTFGVLDVTKRLFTIHHI